MKRLSGVVKFVMVRAYETARFLGDGFITVNHIEIALIIGGFPRERAVELLDVQRDVANKLFERLRDLEADGNVRLGRLPCDTAVAEFLFEHGDVEDIHGLLRHIPETKLSGSTRSESVWHEMVSLMPLRRDA